MSKVCVLGAGSWGTALANLLAKKEYDVTIWSFESEVTDSINKRHQNEKYLKSIALRGNLQATSSIEEAVSNANVVVSVTPAQHVRKVLEQASPLLDASTLLVNASKGIETTTLKTMAQVVEDVLPNV